MKAGSTAQLIAILVASQMLAGCGSAITPLSPVVSFTGDWSLAGNRALQQYPLLSASIVENGSEIFAQGNMVVPCQNLPGTAVGSNFQLSGQIASDGTFQLTPPSNLSPGGGIQVHLTGTVPIAGASTWSGAYAFTDASGYTSCIVNQTASFTAVSFAPLKGTYAGTLGSLGISAALSQGSAAQTPLLNGTQHWYLPLTGTISVTGSPCFAKGVTSTSPVNQIEGDLSFLQFSMDDGSMVQLTGVYDSSDESSLQEVSFAINGGKCSGQAFSGVLTRQ